jgi:hypothetical protein
MTKISSVFAAFAIMSVFSAFVAPVEARETHDGSSVAYASYSPAMAARGERFYTGR